MYEAVRSSYICHTLFQDANHFNIDSQCLLVDVDIDVLQKDLRQRLVSSRMFCNANVVLVSTGATTLLARALLACLAVGSSCGTQYSLTPSVPACTLAEATRGCALYLLYIPSKSYRPSNLVVSVY